MSIRFRLFTAFLLFAILPMFFVALLTFKSAKKALIKTHTGQLESIADLKVVRLEDFFKNLMGDITIAQDYWNIKTNFPILSLYANNRDTNAYLTAKKSLNSQLQIFQKVRGYVDVMLVNPEGNVIYSTNEKHDISNLNRPLPDPNGQAFKKGRSGIYFSDVFRNQFDDNKFGMLVSAPVRDLNNNYIGVIALEIDMSPVYGFIEDTTGLGKSGETLIGMKKDDTALFLNPLRHAPHAALTKSAKIGSSEAYPMQKAVQGRDGVGIQVDYRGEEVLAAWRYVPSLNWGMVAKIDTSEAFASIKTLRDRIIAIGFVLVAMAIITTFYIVKSILNPLYALQEGIKKISGGNFDYKVGTDAHDEIAQLSRAFDDMTTNLKRVTASRDELNTEIDYRKKAETELRKLTVAVEQSPAEIIITNRSGLIEYVNPRFVEVTGYEASEVVGRNPRMLQSGKHTKEFYLELWQTIMSGEVWHGDLQNKRKNGELYWESASIRPLVTDSGVIDHYLAIKVDITKRKKNEARLNELLEELKRSNDDLEQFASVASHDLQEPLRMVSSYMQLLERRYHGKLDKDADDFIGFAVDGANRMQRLINDLLGFSRVGSRGNPIVLANCTGVIKDVLNNLSVTIDKSGATITYDQMPDIKMDKSQILQLFQNLIGNAIKFCEDEPPIIHIGAKRDGDTWLFSVKDNGIGIEPQYYERIFQIFQRLHGKGKYSGTGIGLAVCKRIVERHKGRIWVESTPGTGTVFYFTILI